MNNEANPFGNPAGEEVDDNFEIDGLESDSFKCKPGKHKAKLVDLTKEVSKAGNNMWVFCFAIVAGDDAGKELKIWCALTPRAIFKLNETLQAFKGVEIKDGRASFKRTDIINQEVMIEVEDQEYNGRTTSSIKRAHPLK